MYKLSCEYVLDMDVNGSNNNLLWPLVYVCSKEAYNSVSMSLALNVARKARKTVPVLIEMTLRL